MTFRKGMWLVDGDGDVAIYTKTRYAQPDGEWKWFEELHYVNQLGETVGVYTSNPIAKIPELLGVISRKSDGSFTRTAKNSKGLFSPAGAIVLRQAKFEEIPLARRPDLKNGLKMGYA